MRVRLVIFAVVALGALAEYVMIRVPDLSLFVVFCVAFLTFCLVLMAEP